MSVIGKTHRLWVARDTDNNELVALIHSMYDVPDENFTPKTNVKWLVVRALNIHMKKPWIEICGNFTEAEWETWYALKLVPVIKIVKADKRGCDDYRTWEPIVEGM